MRYTNCYIIGTVCSLGATRDIVPLATVDTPETDVEIIPGEDGSEVRINIARVRLILQNFLFIR